MVVTREREILASYLVNLPQSEATGRLKLLDNACPGLTTLWAVLSKFINALNKSLILSLAMGRVIGCYNY